MICFSLEKGRGYPGYGHFIIEGIVSIRILMGFKKITDRYGNFRYKLKVSPKKSTNRNPDIAERMADVCTLFSDMCFNVGNIVNWIFVCIILYVTSTQCNRTFLEMDIRFMNFHRIS